MTTWKNLVGTDDILLDNHYLYSFDTNSLKTSGEYGTNTQYQTVPLIATLLNTSAWTIEIVACVLDTYKPVIRTYPWGSGGNFIFERGNNVTYLMLDGVSGVKTFTETGDNTTGFMTSYSLRFSNNVLYRNWRVGGEEKNDEIEWAKSSLKTSNYNLGVECKYHVIRLYNRTLTVTDIATNYTIDKQRFNLS